MLSELVPTLEQSKGCKDTSLSVGVNMKLGRAGDKVAMTIWPSGSE